MGNPLDHVTGDFWHVTQEFDRVLDALNVPPFTPQLQNLQQVNIDEIKSVAEKWAGDPSGNIADLARQVTQRLNDVKIYVSKGWSGDDFDQFEQQLQFMCTNIDQIIRPAQRMSHDLHDLATSLEDAIDQIVSVIASLGFIAAGVGAIIVDILAESGPPGWIIGVISSVAAACFLAVNQIKRIEDTTRAASAIMDDIGYLKNVRIRP